MGPFLSITFIFLPFVRVQEPGLSCKNWTSGLIYWCTFINSYEFFSLHNFIILDSLLFLIFPSLFVSLYHTFYPALWCKDYNQTYFRIYYFKFLIIGDTWSWILWDIMLEAYLKAAPGIFWNNAIWLKFWLEMFLYSLVVILSTI